MRKYTKPVMEMEKIEVNQAIAACKGHGDNYMVYKGWQCKWCGLSEAADSYDTKEAGQIAHTPIHNNVPEVHPAYACYDKEGTLLAYYEDYNEDGVLDLEGGDNWQDVKNNIVYQGLFES